MLKKPIQLEEIAGFHIGGALCMLSGFPSPQRFKNDGAHMVGQMYAQHFKLARPRIQTPVALWHGGGLTGASWETTPDGRSGWLDIFLKEGFSAYLCDAFERGRASMPPPPALSELPEYRSLESIWHHFRFGPANANDAEILQRPLKAAYSGQQFPVESLLAFGRQFAPRLINSEQESMAAYAEFLKLVNGCYVVGHSQGGAFAVKGAIAHRSLIRAVVALEPPITEELIADLECDAGSQMPPHLFIFGDYIHGVNSTWEVYLSNAERYCQLLKERGVECQLIELPAIGIHGNSHMLQMDSNSNEIAKLVIAWLSALEKSQ